MQTVHRTTIIGKCPLGCDDLYDAEFHVTNTFIEVGDIFDAIKEATEEPIYQEALTQILADNIGCKVITKGRHMQFETTCEAEPNK